MLITLQLVRGLGGSIGTIWKAHGIVWCPIKFLAEQNIFPILVFVIGVNVTWLVMDSPSIVMSYNYHYCTSHHVKSILENLVLELNFRGVINPLKTDVFSWVCKNCARKWNCQEWSCLEFQLLIWETLWGIFKIDMSERKDYQWLTFYIQHNILAFMVSQFACGCTSIFSRVLSSYRLYCKNVVRVKNMRILWWINLLTLKVEEFHIFWFFKLNLWILSLTLWLHLILLEGGFASIWHSK